MLYFSSNAGKICFKKNLWEQLFAFQAKSRVGTEVQDKINSCTNYEHYFDGELPISDRSQKYCVWPDSLLKNIQDDYSTDEIIELCSFAQSVTASQDGFLLFEESEGRIIICNQVFSKLFNLPDSPLGHSFDSVFGRGAQWSGGRYDEAFYQAARGGSHPFSTEFLLEGPDLPGKKSRWAALFLPYRANRRPARLCCLKKFVGSVDSVEAEEQLEQSLSLQEQKQELLRVNAQLRIENAERSAVAQALRRAESRYRDIFDSATEGIFQWTPDNKLLSANMAFARMMGFPTVNSLFFDAAERGFHFCCTPATEKDLMDQLEQQGGVSNFEFQLVRKDGVQVWSGMNARRVPGAGGYTNYYEAFVENISGRKLTEEKLLYQAFHDPLTSLANRALFHDRLRMALRRVSRQPNYSFAVLYLDLNRFKIVNDSFGHNTGDDVLCHAAVEILSCVRDVDTVARFGGDEFAVLIEEVANGAYAVSVAKRIHEALSRPFMLKGQEINIGASIGIVLRAETYDQPETILRDADTAMYRAKADKSACYKVFNQKMREETLESIMLETDLRQSVKDKDFYLVYQPVVSLATRELYGFEALLRWNRAGRNINSSQFIPVAEETGLIKGLGLFAIEEVCKQMVEWKKRYTQPFIVHLNISGRQLISPGFPEEVRDILERTRVDPSWLLFEITEDVFLNNRGACIQGVHQLRDLGISFCLDDFGTGYSSLSYLRQLPLSCIKVDRSFVTDLEKDSPSLAILRNLLTLGQDLGLSVIVEGIERAAQAEALLAAGCTLAQGYYFHQPLGVDEAAALLN